MQFQAATRSARTISHQNPADFARNIFEPCLVDTARLETQRKTVERSRCWGAPARKIRTPELIIFSRKFSEAVPRPKFLTKNFEARAKNVLVVSLCYCCGDKGTWPLYLAGPRSLLI